MVRDEKVSKNTQFCLPDLMRTISANSHRAHSHVVVLNCQYFLFTQYTFFGAYALLNCGFNHLNSKPHCVADKKSATSLSQLSDETCMAESFLGYYSSSCKEYTALWTTSAMLDYTQRCGLPNTTKQNRTGCFY